MQTKRKSRTQNSLKNRRNKPSLGLFIKVFLLFIILATLPIAYYLSTQNQDVRQQAASCAEEHVNTQFRNYVAGTDRQWDSGGQMKVKIGDKIDVNCFAKTGTALLSNGKITLKVDGVTKSIPSSLLKNQGRSVSGYQVTEGGVHAFTCANNAGCSNTDQINVPKPDPIVCPTDTQQCPDESYVSRVAPDCKFATCPGTEDCTRDSSGAISCPTWSKTPNFCENGKQVSGSIDSCGCEQPPSCEYPDRVSNNCSNPSIADLNNDCSTDLKDYDLFLSEFIKGQS